LNIKADENTSQTNCAEWDSLRHLNLVVELEDAFSIQFEPEEIVSMKSVEAIETIVRAKSAL
jgi:acyl carrier protein